MISKLEQQGPTEYSRPADFAAAGDTIPFLLDNTYHLFHLASPVGSTHHPHRVRCNWVRQRSTDLVHWTRDTHPVIPPGNVDTDPDRSGAWTGSAVLGPDGNLHIFYTGYNLPQGGVQVILHAKSSDREGSSFDKPLGPITLDPTSSLDKYEATDFRDPYVFYNEDEGRYWMVVATRLARGPYWTRGCLALLTSEDLNTWHVQDKPLYAPNNIFCPECPEMFTLGNGKWYIIYSKFSGPHAGTLYVVADSPYGPFRSPRDATGGRFDGRRWYAAKSCPKARDPTRRVAFAWVHDWHEKDGKWLWGGSIVQPREISSAQDGSLRIAPTAAFLGALQDVPPEAGLAAFPEEVELGEPGVTSVATLPTSKPSATITRVFSFRVQNVDAKSFGLLLNFDEDMRGYRVSFEQVSDDVYSVVLVADLPPLDDFWAQLTRQDIPRLVDGPELVRHSAIKLDGPLRLFLSEDIIEVFVGGKAITYRLPERDRRPITAEDGHENGPRDLPVLTAGLFVEDGRVQFTELSLKETSISRADE